MFITFLLENEQTNEKKMTAERESDYENYIR